MNPTNTYKEHINLLDSIESKIKVLNKYKTYFEKEELDFINKSSKSRKIFENKSFYSDLPINNELLKQDLITTNNVLNSFINYLKEKNIYISENITNGYI
jgi:hypothetical protein